MKRELESRRSRRWRVRATVAALGCVAAGTAGAVEVTLDFLPAVQSVMQNARVTLVNLTPVTQAFPPDPCRAEVQFFNSQGDPVGAKHSLLIRKGHTAQVVAPPMATVAGVPVALRAQVSHQRSRLPPDPCSGLHGSYDVFNTQTLETQFINPGVIRGFNPQPDPPG